MRILLILIGLIGLLSKAVYAGEVAPATAFFPVLPFGAGSDAPPQLVPFAANMPLDGVHAGVTRAIVIIHDDTRDARAAQAMMSTMAGNLNEATLIVAPQFLLPSDIVRYADTLPSKGRGFTAWQVRSWIWGDDSMGVPGQKSVSSYAVLDLFLMYLSDRAFFPDLQRIVIAGFGAGANFVQRYAVFSSAVNVVSGVQVRFVVAGATSYLYQTASRPLGGSKGFGLSDPAACPSINKYPYGMEDLNPYARRLGVNAAKVGYGTRAITYLSSTSSRTSSDPSCAALAQGKNSWVRTENYRLYLHTIYGANAEKMHTFEKVGGDASDPVALFGSSCGMSALFGDGMCASATRGGDGDLTSR